MSDNTTAKKPRKVKGKTIVDIQKCKGCEICITACSENGIKLSKEINNLGYRYAVIVDDLCTGCTNCALVFPDGVIKVYRTSAKKKERLSFLNRSQPNHDLTPITAQLV